MDIKVSNERLFMASGPHKYWTWSHPNLSLIREAIPWGNPWIFQQCGEGSQPGKSHKYKVNSFTELSHSKLMFLSV